MSSIMDYAVTLDPALVVADKLEYVGLFPRGYVSLVAGEPGVGKTWFMLDVCRAVADGRVGMGDPINPYKKGKALIFAGETGVRMLIERMSLLGGVKNLQSVKVVSSHQMVRCNIDVMLNTAIGRKNIEAAVMEYRPDVVFVDTVIAFMGDGKDESSQVDMSDSIRVLGMLASASNSAIVLLHHFRKRKGSSDSSERSQNEVIGTSAFTRLTSLVVGIERKRDVRRVICLKSWWEEFNPFEFKIASKKGGVVLEKSYTLDSEGSYSTIPTSRRVLDWVMEHYPEGAFKIADVVAGTGLSRNTVATALSAGLTQKNLRLETGGIGGKEKTYIVCAHNTNAQGELALEA